MYRKVIEEIKIDLPALESWYNEVKEKFTFIKTSPVWGGISLWSGDGTIEDGWHSINSTTRPDFRTYTKPTPACYGPAKELIDQLTLKNYNPYRIRLVIMPASMREIFHKNSEVESFRIFVPILSGPWVSAEYKREKVNRSHGIECGQAYLFRQDVEHRLINLENHEFVTIIADKL